jgi:hypothetical protein
VTVSLDQGYKFKKFLSLFDIIPSLTEESCTPSRTLDLEYLDSAKPRFCGPSHSFQMLRSEAGRLVITYVPSDWNTAEGSST